MSQFSRWEEEMVGAELGKILLIMDSLVKKSYYSEAISDLIKEDLQAPLSNASENEEEGERDLSPLSPCVWDWQKQNYRIKGGSEG